MWPEPVERIATFLRASGAEGQLEQLPADVDEPPGPAVSATAFECDRRGIVVLTPVRLTIDRDKVSRAAGCTSLRAAPLPGFPFQPARVFLDRSLLVAGTVWLEAGSPRYVLGLSPAQLTRLTQAETADLLLET